MVGLCVIVSILCRAYGNFCEAGRRRRQLEFGDGDPPRGYLVIAWALVLLRGEAAGIGMLSRRTLGFLMLSGAATGASWLFYFRALQLGNASLVAPLDKTSVVIVVVLSAVVLGEPLTPRTIVGALLIVGGTLVLIAQ